MSIAEFLFRVVLPGLAILAGWVWTAAKLYHVYKALDTRVGALEGTQKGLRDDLGDKLKELEDRLADYDARFDNIRQSASSFAKDAELADFIVEQHKRWEEVQRTLGQIEGLLRAGRQRRPR